MLEVCCAQYCVDKKKIIKILNPLFWINSYAGTVVVISAMRHTVTRLRPVLGLDFFCNLWYILANPFSSTKLGLAKRVPTTGVLITHLMNKIKKLENPV